MRTIKHKHSAVDIEKMLVSAGVKPTLQRISLAQHVLNDADHPTAEEVKLWAEKNLAKISQATIYNTLNALVEAGLIRAFRFPHSEKVIYDCNTDDHFHFFDESSGQVFDIHQGDINVRVEIPKNFRMKAMDLVIALEPASKKTDKTVEERLNNKPQNRKPLLKGTGTEE